MSPRATVLPLLLAMAGALGCRGCHDDHPYVPYAIGSSERGRVDAGGDAAPAASAASAPSDAGSAFAAEPRRSRRRGCRAGRSPGSSSTRRRGSVFVSAVVRDFDGDGAAGRLRDRAAGRRATIPGRLAFYRGAPARRADAAIAAAGDVRSLAGHRARGRHARPLDRLVARRTPLGPRGARRPVSSARVAARPIAGSRSLTGGRSAARAPRGDDRRSAGAPSLAVDADVSDRDGDGLEDVALRVTLEGGSAPLEPGPRVATTLAWLDRPAGRSRDAGATEASFALAGGAGERAGARARGTRRRCRASSRRRARSGAPSAPTAGAPRLVGVAGTGAITCGSTRALEDAGLAEVRSYVTLGRRAARRAGARSRRARPPRPARRRASTEARGWIESDRAARAARARSAPIARGPAVGQGPRACVGCARVRAGRQAPRAHARGRGARRSRTPGDEAAADDVPAWPAAVDVARRGAPVDRDLRRVRRRGAARDVRER